jgi:CRP-like cAMP-binding protein
MSIEVEQGVAVGPRGMAAGGNAVLAAIGEVDLVELAEGGRRVRLARGNVLTRANQPAPTAYFPENGVASVVKPEDGGRRTEVCLLGPESFSGPAVVLADGRWPYETFVQVDSLTAVAVDADLLRRCFAANSAIRRVLLRAAHVLTVQIAEGLVSAAWQQIEARLARWLLMYRDRLGSDSLEITHQFMSMMVGAQRTRITAALHEMEGQGALSAGRGRVLIRDVALLEAMAKGGYGVPEREAERLGAA